MIGDRRCEFCGGAIRNDAGYRTKTCGARPCRAALLAKQRRLRKLRLERVVGPVQRLCIVCGGPLPPRLAPQARLCSYACQVERRKRSNNVNKRRRVARREQRPCAVCGGVIPPSRPGIGTTCGAPDCRDENRRRLQRKHARLKRERKGTVACPSRRMPDPPPRPPAVAQRPGAAYVLVERGGVLWRVDKRGYWPPVRDDHSCGVPPDHRDFRGRNSLVDFRGFERDTGEGLN